VGVSVGKALLFLALSGETLVTLGKNGRE